MSLSFLDEKERELRRYAGVPALAGVNRCLWNRRLPGVPNVLASDLEPWNRGDGAMVVPGTYAVAMTVDGKAQTQSFAILRDPRIKTKVGDMQGAVRVPGRGAGKLGEVNAGDQRDRRAARQTALLASAPRARTPLAKLVKAAGDGARRDPRPLDRRELQRFAALAERPAREAERAVRHGGQRRLRPGAPDARGLRGA